MDPYLEGYLWPDVHHRLASQIGAQLAPALAPRYVARIVLRTVVEELSSGDAIGVVAPDVEVTTRPRSGNGATIAPAPPNRATGVAVAEQITPAAAVAPQPFLFETRLATVEIRDVAGGLLVASIEILSPTNKRGNGWDEYQAKRRRVIQAQAHLLEIDLLRRGRRPASTMSAPSAPYYAFLTRAQQRDKVEIWPMALEEPLPTLPVPLRAPDQDAPLNLQTVLITVYHQARYDLSIDYTHAPNPTLKGEHATWAQDLLGVQWPAGEDDD
jgi:hypothetical protein